MATLSEHFARTLHETARLWRVTLDRRLRPLGMTQAKWITLLLLARAPSGLTQKELASRLAIEGATLVGLLDRLTADGLVERREVPHDRRSKTVHLTAGAQPLLEEITGRATALRRELLAGIEPAELEQCLSVLERIRSATEAFSHPEEDNDPG